MNLTAAEVLGAMITPAVLISASGSLVISTSNRLSRVVDRFRTLAREDERREAAPRSAALRTELLAEFDSLGRRALLLRSALTALYVAIGLLVATSLAIAVVALEGWRASAVPIAGGLLGAGALLYAALLLIREARLAIDGNLREIRQARDRAAARGPASGG